MSRVIPIPWPDGEEDMARKTATTWLPVAHGGALTSDFSSSRWKGVTASEDGRRDATINRGLTRRRRTSSILSSAPPLCVLFLSLPLSRFLFPSARHFRTIRSSLSKATATTSPLLSSRLAVETTLIILLPVRFYGDARRSPR